MNIVIADDETLVRVSLISMINEMETSWEIVGEANDGEELVELIGRCKPEVAIVDIRMPYLDGIEAIRKAKMMSPRTKWIVCSGYSDFQYAQQALQLGVLAIRQYMQKHLVYGANMALLTLASGECVTVGVWDPEKMDAGAQIAAYMKALDIVMTKFRSPRMAISAIQTEECNNFSILLEQIGQIQKLAGIRSIKGLNRKWLIADVRSDALSSSDMKVGTKLVQLTNDYKNNLYMNYQKTLEDLEVLLIKGDMFTDAVRTTMQQYLNIALPLTLQDRNLKAWMQPLRTLGEALLTQNHSEQTSMDAVDYIVAMIEMNYMNNIGIGQIAGELNITSSYLSKLFHKKVGTSFVKYLTRVRINKAKELLIESNLQIQQVAEQVGYYSTRHFTKLFTEAVGVYPSDFKRSMLLKN